MGTWGTMVQLTANQYDLVYNSLSLGLASMAASTVFFFLRLGSFHERYQAALCFTGLVTFIAMYLYFRIFDSFVAAYTPCKVTDGEVNYNQCNPELYGYSYWHPIQRCLPVRRLVPYRPSAPHRDRPRDAPLRGGDLPALHHPRRRLCSHDPQRLPW